MELFQHALQLQQSGNLKEAWNLYQTILKTQPNHIPTLNQIGNIFYQQKEYKKASEIFRHILQFQPFSADIWYRCGMAYFQIQDKQAIECFGSINSNDIKGFSTIVPLKEIVLKFHKTVSPFFEIIENKMKQNQKLTELKALLLSKMATEA